MRRGTRYALLALLFIGVPWGLYELLERAWRAEQAGQYDRLLLPALSLALIVLILGVAGGRLVEDQDRRTGEDGVGQADTLAEPAR